MVLLRCMAGMVLAFGVSGAWAGLSVYTSWTSLPPNPSANERTIDFNTNTLASEQTAGKLTYSTSVGASESCGFLCTRSAGSIAYNSTSSLSGFSGNVGRLTSGTTTQATSVTINFTNPTPYVGFLWAIELNAENSMLINLTLENNAVVTLKNCSSTSNVQCVGKYVSTSWLNNLLNALLGWLLGDAVEYHPVYMQYEPDNGVKIKSMQIVVYNCAGCGFLSSNTSQDLKFDYITYVDASVAPHHLELTSASATATVNAATSFTVKACGDASCSTKYISGVTGTLSIAGVTAASSNIAFSIPAGPNNTTSVSATMTSAGTATISLPTISPNPTNTPKVYCGMGTAATSGGSCNITVGTPGPHHLEVTTATSSTLTCQPVSYTIKACSDAACSSVYTGGMTGKLYLTTSTVSFSIPASGSTTASAYATAIGSAGVSLGDLSLTPSGTPAVYCGMGGAAAASGGSCNVTVLASGLLLNVPHHVSESLQTLTVSAVQSTNNSNVCTPTFVSTTKTVNFKCGYTNPSSGTVPVRLAGGALNAGNNASAVCDGTGRNLNLTFNASGVASADFQYADAGRLLLTGTYTGSGADAGLVITGTRDVVVAPASFGVSATAGTIKAGNSFTATVTARNTLGNTTTNFGRESTAATASLAFTRTAPTGAGAQDGTFSGSLGAFTNGVATSVAPDHLKWTEVGRGNLTASLTGGNYLSSGLNVTGTASSLGPFIPHHFTVVPVNACVLGSSPFTYSGQPFSVVISALNAGNALTLNYDGSSATTPNQAQSVTLSAPGVAAGVAGFINGTETIAATRFTAGMATVTSVPTFRYVNNVPAAPLAASIRAVDANAVSSEGFTEGSIALRAGRVKISNAFGSEKASLQIPVQFQYWSGQSWVLNALDSCTALPASSVSLSNYRNSAGAATNAWTTTASAVAANGGNGTLTLTPPAPASTGMVDLAFNLGPAITTTDSSCLATHAAGVPGAAVPWLRSNHGTCASNFSSDPSARITFGIYSPESRRTVHARELF